MKKVIFTMRKYHGWGAGKFFIGSGSLLFYKRLRLQGAKNTRLRLQGAKNTRLRLPSPGKYIQLFLINIKFIMLIFSYLYVIEKGGGPLNGVHVP